jgi:hypothetical protein
MFVFLDRTFEGEDFLENNLPELLEDIDLNLRRQIWFQHDGVPPQNSRLTQQVLNTWYPHSWISRGMDFFSVESIHKDYIHREPVDTLEELKNRLQESIAALISEMLRNVQNNLLRRATLCMKWVKGSLNILCEINCY